jgi:5'-3' exoribonuclease 1
MGIPSYFSHIIKNYSGIQLPKLGESVSHFFMDCNSIIYDVYHAIINNNDSVSTSMTYEDMEARLIAGIIEKILHYIRVVSPRSTVFIAFDGVAPFAKMEQQRTRRYRSWFLENGLVETPGTKSKYPIYSSMFTPGTPFMLKLSKEVERFFERLQNITYIVSASTQVGEGEHKLFEYLRKYSARNRETCSLETMVLYGLDADLIMLSIFHCNLLNNIFILREMPDKRDKAKMNLVYIDMKALCKGIIKEFTGTAIANVLYIYDYVFLCFFLGNDFLPHFPSLNIRTSGITSLTDAYRKTLFSKRLHIISENDGELSIEWGHLQLLINELARCEYSLIQTEYKLREKNASRVSHIPPTNPKDMEEFVNDIPMRYRAEEMYISPDDYYWQRRYYSSLFLGGDVKVDAICKNYLEGLEWVFMYYSRGCPHWRWKYNYSYPPLLEDLRKYVLPGIAPIADFHSSSNALNMAFPAEMQLVYVLPRPYLGLLSESVQVFLRDKMDFYPETAHGSGEKSMRFLWAFCRFFWEAHVLLPEIPLEEWSMQMDV